MTAAEIQQHIEELVAEEHRLRGSDRATLHETDRTKLAELEVQLDRYYDLLRQRRARAEFDQDPDRAQLRSGDTVEDYLQ